MYIGCCSTHRDQVFDRVARWYTYFHTKKIFGHILDDLGVEYFGIFYHLAHFMAISYTYLFHGYLVHFGTFPPAVVF
jgi:hypothetical protein